MPNIALKMYSRAARLHREFPAGSLWEHHTGRRYVVLGVANTANYNVRYRPVVVFQSVVNLNFWTKTPGNFRRKMRRIA